jgi:hypothetical protein
MEHAEDYYLRDVTTSQKLFTFQRNILPPSSGLKSKLRKPSVAGGSAICLHGLLFYHEDGGSTSLLKVGSALPVYSRHIWAVQVPPPEY